MGVKYEWDLTSIYQGFDDPAFGADLAKIIPKFTETEEVLDKICRNRQDPVSDLRQMLEAVAEFRFMLRKPMLYIGLRTFFDTSDEKALAEQEKFDTEIAPRISRNMEEKIENYLKHVPDLESVLCQDGFLWQNRNFLRRTKDEAYREAEPEKIEKWREMEKDLEGRSLSDYIDNPSIPLNGQMVSPYSVYEWAVHVTKDERSELLRPTCEAVADLLIEYKKKEIFYKEMYGFHSLLEMVLLEEYMKPDTWFFLAEVFEENETLLEDYEKAMKKVEKYIDEHYISPKRPDFKELSPNEEVEKVMKRVTKQFENICPDFATYMWRIAEKGWIDFYRRDTKKLGVGTGECIRDVLPGESRISIQGDRDILSAFEDIIVHESAHAYTYHLSKEDKLAFHQSGILAEVFSVYTSLVVDRSIRSKGRNSCYELFEQFDYNGKVDMDMSKPFWIYELFKKIRFEKKLLLLIGEGEVLDFEKINHLYNKMVKTSGEWDSSFEYSWAFDRRLFSGEYGLLKYLMAEILARSLDKKIQKQGNVFRQEDMELWREIPQLSVEEFVKKMTGKECTKETWSEMLEESLFQPMRNLISMTEQF